MDYVSYILAKKYVNETINESGALAGASAYDTLKELGDLIDDNTDAIKALETIAVGKANESHTHTKSEIIDFDTQDIVDQVIA